MVLCMAVINHHYCIHYLALPAFVEQPMYTVTEADEYLEICVVLEGMLEADITLRILTEDDTATGIFLGLT